MSIGILTLWYLLIAFLLLGNKTKELANKTDTQHEVVSTWDIWCINDVCFDLELAKTPEARKLGLMNREYLWESEWMLFVFDKITNHKFWMKDTLIPLDMIWLDKDQNIVYIQKMAKPCWENLSSINACPIYDSHKLSKYVLEINGWLTDKYNIKVWDKFYFKK